MNSAINAHLGNNARRGPNASALLSRLPLFLLCDKCQQVGIDLISVRSPVNAKKFPASCAQMLRAVPLPLRSRPTSGHAGMADICPVANNGMTSCRKDSALSVEEKACAR